MEVLFCDKLEIIVTHVVKEDKPRKAVFVKNLNVRNSFRASILFPKFQIIV